MSDPAIRNALDGLAGGCHGIVTRNGEQDACGKTPTMLIDARTFEDGCIWPACTYHAHRYGRGHVVPLAAIIRELSRTGGGLK